MWLSKRMGPMEWQREAADAGTVSIGGEDAAVVTDAERREAKVVSPGGYVWQPGAGQSVLVLKSGDTYIPGTVLRGAAIAPGEVRIFSNGSSVTLRNNGKIEINGEVYITGKLFVNGEELGADDGESDF